MNQQSLHDKTGTWMILKEGVEVYGYWVRRKRTKGKKNEALKGESQKTVWGKFMMNVDLIKENSGQ